MSRLRNIHQTIVANLDNPVRGPFVDRRALGVYAITGAMVVLELIYFAFSDFYLGSFQLGWLTALLCMTFIFALYLRRRHFGRLAQVFEGLAVPGIAGALAVVGTTFLAAESFPFVDRQLDAMDKAMGFDFLALLKVYRDNPGLTAASQRVYVSLGLQTMAVPVLLAACGRDRSLWTLLTAWCIALFTAVAIFPFATAASPYVLHGVPEDVIGPLQQFYPHKTGQIIEQLRDGTIRDIAKAARGLVSMPSFHAIAGYFFIFSTWQFRWLRWPMLLLNLAMIGSVVITGQHYLIDVVGALIVAPPAWWIAARIVLRLEQSGGPQASSSTSQ